MRLKPKLWWLWYGCVALAVAVFFSWLQWSANLPDPDSFYHARILTVMLEQGVLYQFPWLQQTSLAQHFTDHHLLYHLISLPWLYWFEPVTALKITQVWLVVALTVALLKNAQQLLRRFHGSVIVALLVLFTVAPFLVRLNLLKASALALLLFFCSLYVLFQKRYGWALLIAMMYVYAHGGFILTLVIALCLFAGDTIAGSLRVTRCKLGDPRPIWATVIGTILGVVINPYFPNNLGFYWQQLVQIGFVNYHSVIAVGAEWYPFDQGEFVGLVSIILIGVVGAIVVGVQQRRRYLYDAPAISLCILSILLCIATLRSRRFIEYFVPVVWLWCVYMIIPQLVDNGWRKKLQWLKREFGRGYLPFMIYMIFAIVFNGGKSIWIAYTTLHQDATPITTFQGASDWLRTNTQEGEIVFHASWDDWPILFYHNPHNYYLVGLDPTFMYLYNRNQYQRWQDISNGKVKDNVASEIKQSFHARYVFIDTTNSSAQLFAAYLARDAQTERVFADDTTQVYHLK